MKKLIFISMILMLALQMRAQVEPTTYWQFTPRVGYDVWPNYNNNLKYVDYDGGMMYGVSVDKYWNWFGMGLDFDYINNHSVNDYPETDLHYLSRAGLFYFDNVNSTDSKIDRFFLGIGPNVKHQSNDNKFVAELNTRFGLANVEGGYTQLTAQDPIGSSAIILNEHAGYDGERVFSYKGQLRANYYFNDLIGVHAGAYYMNHTNANETITTSGVVEQNYDVIETSLGNEVLISSFNIRDNACDCDIESVGLFGGVSLRLYKKEKYKCNHIPVCVAPCTVDKPVTCITCPSEYAVRVIVKDAVSGERIDNATIQLVGADSTTLSGDSSDNGGKTFEDIKEQDYTTYATVDGVKTTVEEIEDSELIAGRLITKTVYVKEIQEAKQDVTVIVKDRPTGQIIPNADVVIKDESGNIIKTGSTNSLGAVSFTDILASDYLVEGKVYGVGTTNELIDDVEFDTQSSITKTLYYEDLRFILNGKTVDTYTKVDKPNVNVILKNDDTKNVQQSTSDASGDFTFRLDKHSAYTIQGQKRGEFSEIEYVTTKPLKRSETLFVELELSVAVPKCNQNIPLKNIYFQLDKWDIQVAGAAELDRVYQLLVENPGMKIVMSSHTDSRGSSTYNETLSQNRANSTKTYLVNKGISANRITAIGYGENKLVNHCADNVTCSETEHQMNRRTEMKVICQ